MKPVSVVITSYNTRADLRRCLTSVLQEAPALVVVADNGSGDGSVEMVAAEFPGVVLDLDRSNPGYGGAANRGLRRSTTDYVLILNSDTVVQPGTLRAIADYLDRHPRVGILGPRLLNPDGSLQRSCWPFPSPLHPMHRHRRVASVIRLLPVVRDRALVTWQHDTSRQVPWVTGAALAIRRSAFEEIGGFDEAYFMFSEEIDLCYRLNQCGWETHFSPAAEVTHVGGTSTRQHRPAMWAQQVLSAMRYYERHYSGPKLAIARTLIKGSIKGRLWRDRTARMLTRSDARRAQLDEMVSVWRGVLQRLHAARPQ